jgi:hypothetical protein
MLREFAGSDVKSYVASRIVTRRVLLAGHTKIEVPDKEE